MSALWWDLSFIHEGFKGTQSACSLPLSGFCRWLHKNIQWNVGRAKSLQTKQSTEQNFDVSLRQNYISLFLPSESKQVRVLYEYRNEEKSMLRQQLRFRDYRLYCFTLLQNKKLLLTHFEKIPSLNIGHKIRI